MNKIVSSNILELSAEPVKLRLHIKVLVGQGQSQPKIQTLYQPLPADGIYDPINLYSFWYNLGK